MSHYCLTHAVCAVVAVPALAADRRAEDSDTVGQDTTVVIDEEVGGAIPAAEGMDDEAEARGAPLVVAGVDASAESLAAAHYAVMAAELRGGDVLLVHSFPPPSARAPDTEAAFSAARTAAEKLLTAVAAQLVVPAQVTMHGRVEPDDAVTVLQASAGQAAMLVLGRDDVSWFERLFMGAVTSQVVGQVTCPVVVVPGRQLECTPCLSAAAGDRCTRWRDSAGACLEAGVRGGEAA